jgi:hypothetical protein
MNTIAIEVIKQDELCSVLGIDENQFYRVLRSIEELSGLECAQSSFDAGMPIPVEHFLYAFDIMIGYKVDDKVLDVLKQHVEYIVQ